MKQDKLTKYFRGTDDRLNQAYITNDIAETEQYLSPGWGMLEPEIGIIDKERFLQAVKKGELLLTQMKKEVMQVNAFGETVIVITRGMNVGVYKGKPFNSEHWVADIYKK